VFIPDFYEMNGEPSFVAMRAIGVRCVGLKASEGISYVDAKFHARRRRAVLTGMKIIPYHFARPDLHPTGAKTEAQHFCSVIGKIGKRVRWVALDFETHSSSLDRDQMVAWARDFNHEVKRLRDRWPLFYSYRDFIAQLAPTYPIGGGLWLAEYGPNNGRPFPTTPPAPWKRIRLHQFTSKGKLYGATPPTDLSQIV
jgi:GH25 family lysozyme M1 (1,4-beta-N-acetylmuramidase)